MLSPNHTASEPDGLDDTARMLPIEMDERAVDHEPTLPAPADMRGCCGRCAVLHEGNEQIGEVDRER